MARKDPRTGRFLPKEWKGSFYDTETKTYRTGNNRRISKERAVKNALDYTRDKPKFRKYTRRQRKIVKAKQAERPNFTYLKKVGKKRVKKTLKQSDFSLETAERDRLYLYYVDIIALVRAGTSDPARDPRDEDAWEQALSLTIGTYTPEQFETMTEGTDYPDLPRDVQETIGRYEVIEFLGYWRSPTPVDL